MPAPATLDIKYDPAQTRDPHGRWSGDGLGASTAAFDAAGAQALSGDVRRDEGYFTAAGDYREVADDNRRKATRGVLNHLAKTAVFPANFIHYDDAVRHLMTRWGGSSGGSVSSLLLQTAAAEEFGASPAATLWANNELARQFDQVRFGQEILQSEPSRREMITWDRAVLRAMYDNTQEYFKQRGITQVSVARGMGYYDQPSWLRDLPSNTPTPRDMHSRPLSSWSLDPHTAGTFAGVSTTGRTGVLLRATMPVSRILSLPMTGMGTTDEAEVVVLDGPGQALFEKLVRRPDGSAGTVFSVPKAFDAAQPRDDHGRWSPGGGGLEPRFTENQAATEKLGLLGADRLPFLSVSGDYGAKLYEQEEQRVITPIVQRILSDPRTPAAFDQWFGNPEVPWDTWTEAERDYTLREELVNVRHTWAGASPPEDPQRQIVLRAVAAEFGTRRGRLIDQPDDAQRLPFYRVVVRAMYDETQAQLKAAGVSEIAVARGMRWKFDPPAWAVKLTTDWSSVSVASKPISSWTAAADVASAFSAPMTPNSLGVVLHATVPASRVFATARTGIGSASESEVVVLDTPGRVLARRRDLSVPGKSFDPSEPRDPHGQWTGGGGEMVPRFDTEQAHSVAAKLDLPPEEGQGYPDDLTQSTMKDDFRFKLTQRITARALKDPRMQKAFDRWAHAIQKLPTNQGWSNLTPAERRVEVSGLVKAVRENWGKSSGARTREAYRWQRAIADEFSLRHVGVAVLERNASRDIDGPLPTKADMAAIQPILQVLARAMYDATQERLAAAGVTEVPILRGLRFFGVDRPPAWTHNLSADHWTPVDIASYPASSWTINEGTANSFTYGEGAITLEATVPASRVFSTGATALGQRREQEVIVLDGPGQAGARAYSYANDMVDYGQEHAVAGWKGFDPDELRDEQGRWTAGDGDPSGAARRLAASLKAAHPTLEKVDFRNFTPTYSATIASKYTEFARDYPGPAALIKNLSDHVLPNTGGARNGKFDLATTSVDGAQVLLNKRYFGNPELFAAVSAEGEKAGWHLPDMASPKATLDHEFGHVVSAYLTRQQGQAAYMFIWGNFDRTADRHLIRDTGLGGYANTDAEEAFAEGFAFMRKHPTKDWPPFVRRQALYLADHGLFTKSFDPSQPRDDAGRWISGSGASLKPAFDPFEQLRVSSVLFPSTSTSPGKIRREAEQSRVERAIVDKLLANPEAIKAYMQTEQFARTAERFGPDPTVWPENKLRLYMGIARGQADSSWGLASNDPQMPSSLVLQKAAAQEFKTRPQAYVDALDQRLDAQAAVDEDSKGRVEQARKKLPFFRHLLRAMHDVTQERLATEGITELPIQRGLAFGEAQKLPPVPAWAAGLREGVSIPIEAMQRPLSSWTTRASTANAFGHISGPGLMGVVLSATVPASSVLSTGGLGLGTPVEHEVVVIDTPGQVLAKASGDLARVPGGAVAQTKAQVQPGFIQRVVWHALAPFGDSWIVTKFDPDQARDEHGRWIDVRIGITPLHLYVPRVRMVTDDRTMGERNVSWAKQAFSSWRRSLTSNEKTSLNHYVGTGWQDINPYLRQGPFSHAPAYREAISGEVNNIDTALAKARTTRDVDVWRVVDNWIPGTGGESPDLSGAYKMLRDAPIGTTFTDAGFVSTSLRPDISDYFGAGPQNEWAMVQIHVPKGSHAGYLHGGFPASSDDEEHELLIQRDSTFKVVSKSVDQWKRLHVALELVPPTKAFEPDEPRDEHGRWTAGEVSAALEGMGYERVGTRDFLEGADENARGGLGTGAFLTQDGVIHDIHRAEHPGVRGRLRKLGISDTANAGLIELLANHRETDLRIGSTPSEAQMQVIRSIRLMDPVRNLYFTVTSPKGRANGGGIDQLSQALFEHFGVRLIKARQIKGPQDLLGGSGEAPESLAESGIDVSELVGTADELRLRAQLEDLYTSVLEKTHAALQDALGVRYGLTPKAVAAYRAQAGDAAQGIIEVTRSTLSPVMADVMDAARAAQKLGVGFDVRALLITAIRDLWIFGDSRAEKIGLTETVRATNQAVATSLLSAFTAGLDFPGGHLVGLVYTDGDGCGMFTHDDPLKMDGYIWRFDSSEPMPPPIAHPWCVRASYPYFEQDEPPEPQEDQPEAPTRRYHNERDEQGRFKPATPKMLSGLWAVLGVKYDPSEARDEGGRWTDGAGLVPGGLPADMQKMDDVLTAGVAAGPNEWSANRMDYARNLATQAITDRLMQKPEAVAWLNAHTPEARPVTDRALVEKTVVGDLTIWANSAASPESLAIQRAAIAEFGLSDKGYASAMDRAIERYAWREAGTANADFLINAEPPNDDDAALERAKQAARDAAPAKFRAMVDGAYTQRGQWFRYELRAMYDETQARLKAAALENVVVKRGMTFDPHFGGTNPHDAPKPVIAVVSRLYDAFPERTPPTLALQMAPMSSWSTSPSSAENFASSGPGIVLTATIPANRVLSFATTGHGSLPEHEVIVLDTPGRAAVSLPPQRSGMQTWPLSVLKAFDPDQARDEHGRWSGFTGVPELLPLPHDGDQARDVQDKIIAPMLVDDPMSQARANRYEDVHVNIVKRVLADPESIDAYAKFYERDDEFMKAVRADPQTALLAPYRTAVDEVMDSWATGGLASSEIGQVVQQAAQREFNLRPASVTPINAMMNALSDARDGTDVTLAKRKLAMYQRVLRAMYDETQAQFAKAGITRVPLVRGMTFTRSENIFGTGQPPTWATSLPIDTPTPVSIVQRPLSSWSLKHDIAAYFGHGWNGLEGYSMNEMGVVLTASVPVSRILSTAASGLGTSREAEVVVLDSPGQVMAQTGGFPTPEITPAWHTGKAFDPSQARDEGGRWTDSGGVPPHVREAETVISHAYVLNDMRGMDARLAMPVANTFVGLLKQYPAPASTVAYFGTGREPGTRMEGFRYDPDGPEDLGPQSIKDALASPRTAALTRRWRGENGGLRQSVVLNVASPIRFSDMDVMQASMDAAKENKWLAPGTSMPTGVVYHEFGHVVHNYLKYAAPPEMKAAMVRIQWPLGTSAKGLAHATYDISKYAGSSADEAFAEAFAMIHNTPKDTWPPYVKRVERLIAGLRAVKDFDPTQARDDSGRWTSTESVGDTLGMSSIAVPEQAKPVVRGLIRAGGEPYYVGGLVRDALMHKLGYPVSPSKDVDIEVHGLTAEQVTQAIKPFGRVDAVGQAFGVLKLTLPNGEQFDISLPRRESKLGAGHRGFMVEPDPNMTVNEAAARRDFTMNSLLADHTGKVHDPFNGIQDIRDHLLRATSERFADDPLRVLRGVQFAARFNLTMHPETAAMAQTLLPEFDTLSKERIWIELDKWSRSRHPEKGLQVLEQTRWLHAFPALAKLQGTPQDPLWHPEGDVWEHTQQTVARAAEIATREKMSPQDRQTLVLAALLHDVGKPGTTSERDGRIISHGHAEAGADIAKRFLSENRTPDGLTIRVSKLVKDHMIHTGAEPTTSTVQRLARRLGSHSPDEATSVRMLAHLAEADASGRHPAPPAKPMAAWMDAAERAAVADGRPEPIIQGRHLMAFGRKPGPEFGPLLREAFDAQLDGVFHDESGAQEWLSTRLKV